ncbi:hypothetical protein LMG31841_03548 [Paraburkholderia saeva]|uniref:Pyridoxal phosphate biosynthetic protein PdxJ n=2 Tax=Paraburkholderia saeva TaxID=2777537 RepID=A0A9N8RYD9_9BURK|nr:hypothetical protein LMG31841_03548 [Paraburkholderia saeva]
MPETRALPLDEPIVTGNTKAAVKAAGGKSADLWMLPYDEIHFDPRDNVRPLDNAWAKHLAKLIQTNGYDKSQPLHCYIRKVNGEDLVYLWKGQHRFHGIGIAIDNGFDPGLIPIVIADAKTVDRVNMIFGGLTSNESKANSPLDLAEKITELREQHGIDDATICKRLEITQQTIRDVMLLAGAPAEIHKLVRTGTVSGTVAIEQIRQHGPEKALERIAKAAEQVKSTGKSKVTKKHLDKAPAARASGKITDLQAKQLLQALQSVLHDPVFGKLSPGTIAGVHAALTPHADLLDAVSTKRTKHPIHTPNEHGAFVDCENIRAPIKTRYGTHPAEIHLAQPDDGVWIYSISAQIGHCMKTGLPSMRHFDATFPTRGQAIRAAVSEFTALIERPNVKGAKELATVRKWLDKLWTMPDPDWTEDMAKEAAK